jgi:hypothetical protein
MKNITHLILLAASVASLPVVLPASAQAATLSKAELRAATAIRDLLPPPPPRPRPNLPVVAAVRG